MGVEKYELQRTDSICPSPEMQLVDFVKSNNVPKIKSFILDSPELLNLVIGHPFDKPILYVACDNLANIVNVNTITALINLGADLYHSDDLHDNKEAIHFAAFGQNPVILKAITDAISPDKLNSTSLGNTALNLLIKQGDAENEGFINCIQVLVGSGLDVNITDGKNKSPIFWAAKKGYKEAVDIILNKSKQEVKLNDFVNEYLLKNNIRVPYNAHLGQNNNNILDALFGYIKIDDEDSFVRCLVDFVDADDGESTFLQLATEKHLKRIVEALLDQGADPNKTTPRKQIAPIEIAVEHGFWEILDLFLKQETIVLPANILVKTLEHVDDQLVSPKINHNKCYDLLLNYKGLNVNAKNEFKTTALHYAAKYGGAERTLDLLRKGASMASKNKFNSMPIEDIDAGVLETHLNECIEVNLDHNVDKENFTATFNYKTLMPPSNFKNEPKKGDVETANALLAQEIKQLASETQVISYMSKSPELRHLLKHPLITSFIYMKWHRIRWFFYCNLAFYILFCLSLILYILLVYDKGDEKLTFLSVCLCATSIILILREIFQILVSPKTYFLDLENYLEVVLVILTSLILFRGNFPDNVKRQIAAVAILLAAFELVVLIGQHPKMTTNIVMLRTVSLNFFKFLLWYSILIIAFSLSFYTLFKKQEEGSAEENPKFFINPGLSLFKTVVMLTGEFEAGDIEFETYPITSHLIFMLFVFMIAIILFNLLNGLAVSDTQIIKSNAELVGYVARIEHIAYIESMFFGHLLPKPVVNYCCCIPFSLTNKFSVPAILIGRVSLFPFYLKDYKLTILPNQQAKVALEASDYSDIEHEGCMTSCNNIYLDKQTAKRTKQLIKTRKEVTDEQESERRVLMHQEAVLEDQMKVINELRHEQKLILSQLEYIMRNMTTKN